MEQSPRKRLRVSSGQGEASREQLSLSPGAADEAKEEVRSSPAAEVLPPRRAALQADANRRAALLAPKAPPQLRKAKTTGARSRKRSKTSSVPTAPTRSHKRKTPQPPSSSARHPARPTQSASLRPSKGRTEVRFPPSPVLGVGLNGLGYGSLLEHELSLEWLRTNESLRALPISAEAKERLANPTYGRAHNWSGWCKISDGWYLGHWVYSCEDIDDWEAEERGEPSNGEASDPAPAPSAEAEGRQSGEEEDEVREDGKVGEEQEMVATAVTRSRRARGRTRSGSQPPRPAKQRRVHGGSRCQGCSCEIGGYGYLVTLQGVQFVGRFHHRTMNDPQGLIIDRTGVYHGGVVSSMDTGHGTFYWRNNGDVCSGMWDKGKVQYGSVMYGDQQSLYTGSFRVNKPDGLGISDYFHPAPAPSNWEYYLGSWRECDWVGPGLLVCSDRTVETVWEGEEGKAGSVGFIESEVVDEAGEELDASYVGDIRSGRAEGQGRVKWEAATAESKLEELLVKKGLKEERERRRLQHQQRVAGDFSSLPLVLEEQEKLAAAVRGLKTRLTSISAEERFVVSSLVGPHSSVYHGGFQQGLMHGQGRREWRNGDVYDGAWQQGICNGYGRWKSSDRYEGLGDVLYAGGWKNDKEHGMGTLINTMPLLDRMLFHGRFNEGLLTGMATVYYYHSKLLYYVGRMAKGAFDGEGVMQLEDGSFYMGGFVDGQFKGAARWVDVVERSVYTGRFKFDYKHGGGRLLIHEHLLSSQEHWQRDWHRRSSEDDSKELTATEAMNSVEPALSQCQQRIRLPHSFGRVLYHYLAVYSHDDPVFRVVGDELDDLLDDIGYVRDAEDEDVDGLVREEQLDCAREEKKRRVKKKAPPTALTAALSASLASAPLLSLNGASVVSSPLSHLSASALSVVLSASSSVVASVPSSSAALSADVSSSDILPLVSTSSPLLDSSSSSSPSPASSATLPASLPSPLIPVSVDDGWQEREKEVQPPAAVEDVDDGMRLLAHYQRELLRLSQRSVKKGKKDVAANASSPPSDSSALPDSSSLLEASIRLPATPLSFYDKPGPSSSLRRIHLPKAVRLCRSHRICSFAVTGHLPADYEVLRCLTCSQMTPTGYRQVEVCVACWAAGCHRGHQVSRVVEKPMRDDDDITSRREVGHFYCDCGLQLSGCCKTPLDEWREAIARASAPPAALRAGDPTPAAALRAEAEAKAEEEKEDSEAVDEQPSACPVLPPLAECPRPSQFLRRGAEAASFDAWKAPEGLTPAVQPQSGLAPDDSASSPSGSALDEWSQSPRKALSAAFLAGGLFKAPKKTQRGQWVKVNGKWQEEGAVKAAATISLVEAENSVAVEVGSENELRGNSEGGAMPAP